MLQRHGVPAELLQNVAVAGRHTRRRRVSVTARPVTPLNGESERGEDNGRGGAASRWKRHERR